MNACKKNLVRFNVRNRLFGLSILLLMLNGGVLIAASSSSSSSSSSTSDKPQHIMVPEDFLQNALDAATRDGSRHAVLGLACLDYQFLLSRLRELDTEQKDARLKTLINTVAFDRALFAQCTPIVTSLCEDLCFDNWNLIDHRVLNAFPVLSKKAVQALVAQEDAQKNIEQLAMKAVDKGYQRILKYCLMFDPDASLCFKTVKGPNNLKNSSTYTLFESCLRILFSKGALEEGELDILCDQPSEDQFNELLSMLARSNLFKCIVMKGILDHNLTDITKTEHVRAGKIHAIIKEMEGRIGGWTKVLLNRDLKKAFEGQGECFNDQLLDNIYRNVWAFVHRGCPEIPAAMLRSAYLKAEVKPSAKTHCGGNLLSALLVTAYCNNVNLNEPLDPENPSDQRPLFFAALLGNDHVDEQFYNVYAKLPEDIFAYINDKLLRSHEFKEWFGRNKEKMLRLKSDCENFRRGSRFFPMTDFTADDQSLKGVNKLLAVGAQLQDAGASSSDA